MDPELFFPIGTTGPALDQIAAAKQVCACCPVKAQCLEFALQTRQDAGIWGGLDEDERRMLRRARQARANRRKRLGDQAGDAGGAEEER
jgi:WhiB family redox-sensing transcriptional regulator